MDTIQTLKQASLQLGIPPAKLLAQLKRDGYAKTGKHGPEPAYPAVSAECLVRKDTFFPVQTSNGVINKRGVTIGVTLKGIDFLARHYSHLAKDNAA